MNITGRLKQFWQKRFEKKEDRLKTLAFAALVLLVLLAQTAYPNFGWLFLSFSLALLSVVMWASAGLVVFRPLFEVGAGLSLMLYLAELYCQLPDRERVSDESLKGLLAFGLLYTVLRFCKLVFGELKKEMKILEEVNEGKKSWVALVLFAAFVGLFIGHLYQVLNPIFMNLCVYEAP